MSTSDSLLFRNLFRTESTLLGAIALGAFLLASPVLGEPEPLPLSSGLSDHSLGLFKVGGSNVTLSGAIGNSDFGYDRTEFFQNHLNMAVFNWDIRAELWLPEDANKVFPAALYIRFAGSVADKQSPYYHIGQNSAGQSEFAGLPTINEWQALPGVGLEFYPFGGTLVSDSTWKDVLGPLRVYAEWNHEHYIGGDGFTSWRPTSQGKAGLDYWKTINANNWKSAWWVDIWNGLWWQSSDEISSNLNSVNFVNSVRAGLRIPDSNWLSAVTPYAMAISSLNNKQNVGGQADYWWDNNLTVGGGVRFAPDLNYVHLPQWINYLNVFAEWGHQFYYVTPTNPFYTHNNFRAGITIGFGDFYYSKKPTKEGS